MGKHKYIETPEKMWELFCSYRTAIKNNTILVDDWVGSKAIRVERERERPLTMEGFENHCFELGEINDLGDYFANKDGRYSEYAAICSRIRNFIRQDQIEGGMVGIYTPSITQRINGLSEKQEVTGVGGAPIKLVFNQSPGCEPIKDEQGD